MSQPNSYSNTYTIGFVVALCFCCSLILSVLASVLKEPQELSRKVDLSQQMLSSARIYNPEGFFQLRDSSGNYVPAKHVENGALEKASGDIDASGTDVLAVYEKRIRPILVSDNGDVQSFEEAGVDLETYISENARTGFSKLPLKLAYEVLENPKAGQLKQKTEGYIIPVSGFGLWGPIRGYLAVEADGIHVRGISWYEHVETPGLGAEISEPPWQKQFFGKQLFQLNPNGATDLKAAPLGITVLRGSVKDTYGDSPKSYSAVDGMAGATLTGVGVTSAYKDTLAGYRPFLVSINKENEIQ